jgi:hypothetical protein
MADDDKYQDLLERLDRVAATMQTISSSNSRGALLLTALEAEGVRVKVKKKNRKKKDR